MAAAMMQQGPTPIGARRAMPQDDAARTGKTLGEFRESLARETMDIGHLGHHHYKGQ